MAEKLSNTAPALHGTAFRMRCPAGRFAITEAEVRIDGVWVTGGNGSFEFDLTKEVWIDIQVFPIAVVATEELA